MPRSLTAVRDEINRVRRQRGSMRIAPSRLVHAAACPDSLQELILLTLGDEVGLEPTYAIDPGFCLQFGTSLAQLATKLIAAAKTPQQAS